MPCYCFLGPDAGSLGPNLVPRYSPLRLSCHLPLFSLPQRALSLDLPPTRHCQLSNACTLAPRCCCLRQLLLSPHWSLPCCSNLLDPSPLTLVRLFRSAKLPGGHRPVPHLQQPHCVRVRAPAANRCSGPTRGRPHRLRCGPPGEQGCTVRPKPLWCRPWARDPAAGCTCLGTRQ